MESQKLMSFLFQKGNDLETEFADDDPSLYADDPNGFASSFEIDPRLKPNLINKLTQIFQRHCAISIEVNLFYFIYNF